MWSCEAWFWIFYTASTLSDLLWYKPVTLLVTDNEYSSEVKERLSGKDSSLVNFYYKYAFILVIKVGLIEGRRA